MNSKPYDFLIIGAGPAGLQLAYFLEKANRNYLIIEAGKTSGTFFKKYPRHRELISINKIYTGYDDPETPMRWDWNSLISDNNELRLPQYTREYFPPADALVDYLQDYTTQYDLKVKYETTIEKIAKDGLFKLWDTEGNLYTSHRLIVATGLAKPYIPPIQGIELTENYCDVSVDPDDFINQTVLIIGKGNSAFEVADNLVGTTQGIHLCSPDSLKMAWQTHFVGNLRAVNNNILDTYQLKSQNAVLDATIAKIEKHGDKYHVTVDYAHANGEQEELIYDRIITCTGFRFDSTIFDETCQPELAIENRFPAQTSAWESTNIKDLYFAGVITQTRDHKKTTSAFIHGFRYNSQALYHILEKRYNDVPWPSEVIEPTLDSLTKAILKQVNTSSSMWQQFGFIGDLVTVSDDAQEIRLYKNLPIEYVHDSDLGQHKHYYLITLEYGEHHIFANPFNVTRIARDDTQNAADSHFLHPIIRSYNGDKLVSVHHIIEDLASRWEEDVHINPLKKYLAQEIWSDLDENTTGENTSTNGNSSYAVLQHK